MKLLTIDIRGFFNYTLLIFSYENYYLFYFVKWGAHKRDKSLWKYCLCRFQLFGM